MFDIHSVPLKTLVDEFQLEVAFAATDYEQVRLTVEDARWLYNSCPAGTTVVVY